MNLNVMYVRTQETYTNIIFFTEQQTENNLKSLDVGFIYVHIITTCLMMVYTLTKNLIQESKKNVRRSLKRMEQEKNFGGSLEEVICEIPMRLPSLNEFIRACRTNKFVGAKMKKDIESDIMWYIQRLPRFEYPVEIDFHWVEENKKRDLDNISYGKKFILDALVKAEKLKDDNRKCVTAFRDTFSYDKESKVILTIKRSEE